MDGVCVLPLYATVNDESLTVNFPVGMTGVAVGFGVAVGLGSVKITKGNIMLFLYRLCIRNLA